MINFKFIEMHTFNEMYSIKDANQVHKTRGGEITRARSVQIGRLTPLNPKEVGLLLSHTHDYSLLASRQELLAERGLFDPSGYFGAGSFTNLRQSQRFHQPRLQSLFSEKVKELERRTPSRVKILSERIIENSSGIGRTQGARGGVHRSPKRYLKQNKENFCRLNINNLQKVRVKLKLGKK